MKVRFPFSAISLAAALGFAAGVGVTHYWTGSPVASQRPGYAATTVAAPRTAASPHPEQPSSPAAGLPVSMQASAGTLRALPTSPLATTTADSVDERVDKARLDPEAREALFRSFLSTQGDERGLWLSALRRLKGDEVKQFAIDNLNDSDPSVRMAAYQMLQDYAPNDAGLQSTLVRQVSVESEPVAQLVLLESVSPSQLASDERRAARQVLEAITSGADPEARAAALGLLTGLYLEGAERTQWLGVGLEDPDARVRTSALASLWAVGSEHVQHWDRIRELATNPYESWVVRDAALALIEREGSPYAGDRWVASTRGVLDNQFANSEHTLN